MKNKLCVFVLFLTMSSMSFAQSIRLRANFYETNIDGEKTQEESDRLLVLDLDKKVITIFGNPSERFDIYESFEIDERTTMFPSIDKDLVEFAIEYYVGDDYYYITIQSIVENESGTFNNRMYVCTLIE